MEDEKTLEERLKEARAKRAQRDAERDAKAKRQRLLDEIAEEEHSVKLDEAVEEAEAEYGPVGEKIAVVTGRYASGKLLGSAIVKKPHPATWKRFRDTALNGKVDDKAFSSLWQPCLVWPEKETVHGFIEELPQFETLLYDTVAALAGQGAKEVGGK